MAEYQYMLDNRWSAARERLAMLETVWDPWTIRHLEAIQVGPGWRCLEVAGGGGSIAEWLCHRVGAGGHVLATDLETVFLESIEASNLEVRHRNILTDELPEAAFDLVHARFLLTFLPEPQLALQRMASALKPGGWLLVEEPDYASAVPDPTMDPAALALSQKCWNALVQHLTARGYDTALGRKLYSEVCAAGVVNVNIEGGVSAMLGGTPCARFWRLTTEQLRDEIIGAALATQQELDGYSALLESSEYRWLGNTMITVWGQKPAA